MKTNDQSSQLEKDAVKQLKKFYKSHDDFLGVSLTWMGAFQILVEFIMDNYKDPSLLPEKARYGVALGLYHLRLLGKILRKEITPEDLEIKHMPISDRAWESGEELNQRMVIIVKELYKGLQEDGLI